MEFMDLQLGLHIYFESREFLVRNTCHVLFLKLMYGFLLFNESFRTRVETTSTESVML